MTPSQAFKSAIVAEKPLQIVGAINAYSALLAREAGFKAIYLSGAGVANASFGLPDLAVTTLNDVVEDARRITGRVDLPLLVDIDTGWGGAFNIARTVREFERAGVACVHIEDQVAQKRCGHRPGKELVDKFEMGDRVKAAVDARSDLLIMARTDALAGEGLDGVIERCVHYVECGADMIFAEAMTDLSHYKKIKDAVKVPVLANLTEFGKTDYYTTTQMADAGVDMTLYPLSAFRAMSRAAEMVYATIRKDGTQKDAVPSMQTREELYKVLDYYAYEQKLDALFGKK
ncbi:methylisocitrate lyase [Micavibrio aeruginosavorus]|uniref:2-methylisocitrate lyase n=1 Tax=Micavibrio aeruginosavorus (strain ARL-13) TaxID=856793 RepID=G2KRF1_MICAA|nr:methylisocitrate lyase [Micavibrio aeruginosavorus]AEP09198.1 methylisocitrate lyase [Micavibrio aeruginosavorus ARL-13]